MRLPLSGKFSLDADLLLAWSHYPHRNVVDFLSGAGSGTRRSDQTQQFSLTLSRPLTAWTSVDVRWTGTRQRSNVDTYTYDRSIVGLFLTARTP